MIDIIGQFEDPSWGDPEDYRRSRTNTVLPVSLSHKAVVRFDEAQNTRVLFLRQ